MMMRALKYDVTVKYVVRIRWGLSKSPHESAVVVWIRRVVFCDLIISRSWFGATSGEIISFGNINTLYG